MITRGEPGQRERKTAGIYRGAFSAVLIQWTTRLVGLAKVVILEAEAARHLHLLRARLLGSPMLQGWRR